MPNPDLIPEPFAQSGDKNPIPLERAISDPVYRASWKAGFPPDTRLPKDVGGEAPDGLDFNGLFNALSQAVVFLQKGNAYQFDVSMAPYPVGALVRSNDNLTTYQSTVVSNSNNPNSNMTGWRIYNGSGFIVDNLTTDDGNKTLSAKQGKVLQDNKLEANKVGAANGVASLDANTKVPVVQLPAASTTSSGAVQLNNTLTSASTTQALTAVQGKVLLEMFASSLNQNSYQKIANPSDPSKPLIIQWGKPGVINSGTTINFPIAFPNQVFIVIASDCDGSSAIGSSDWTLTNFKSRSGSAIAYNWFAIGY